MVDSLIAPPQPRQCTSVGPCTSASGSARSFSSRSFFFDGGAWLGSPSPAALGLGTGILEGGERIESAYETQCGFSGGHLRCE